MWTQFIKFRTKPDTEAQVKCMIEHLVATALPDSGLVRELATSGQPDPMSAVIAR